MSKCPFVLMPKAAAWHVVATQQQTRRLSIFQVVFLQPGDSVLSAARNSLTVSSLWSRQLFKCNKHIYSKQWWGWAWFPRYQLCWVADTQQEPHQSNSRGECARPFLPTASSQIIYSLKSFYNWFIRCSPSKLRNQPEIWVIGNVSQNKKSHLFAHCLKFSRMCYLYFCKMLT